MALYEAALQWAVDFANDDSHGYSQDGTLRWTTQADCSSLTYRAYQHAGYPIPHGVNDKTGYTGSMVRDFTAAGFECLTYNRNALCRGDIILAPSHHVEMYLGDGLTVAAHGGSYSVYDYGHEGDTNNVEINVSPVWNFGQSVILRPPDSTHGTQNIQGSATARRKVTDMFNIRIGTAADRIILDPINKKWMHVVLPEEVQFWDNLIAPVTATSEQLAWAKNTLGIKE